MRGEKNKRKRLVKYARVPHHPTIRRGPNRSTQRNLVVCVDET